jgi:hypothetical protein
MKRNNVRKKRVEHKLNNYIYEFIFVYVIISIIRTLQSSNH